MLEKIFTSFSLSTNQWPDPEAIFDRQTLIKGWDQSLISSLSLLIVGCGALGGWFAQGAVRMGINKLTLLDFDLVDPSNLPRQLFSRKDIGKSKALQLAKFLNTQRTNPRTQIEAFPFSFQHAMESGMHLDHDVAFVGVDNDASRGYASRLMHGLSIPVIFTGTGQDSQKGYVFIQRDTSEAPCLACLNPEVEANAVPTKCVGTAADVPLVLAGLALYSLETLVVDRKITWDLCEVFLPTGQTKATRIAKRATCEICSSR